MVTAEEALCDSSTVVWVKERHTDRFGSHVLDAPLMLTRTIKLIQNPPAVVSDL